MLPPHATAAFPCIIMLRDGKLWENESSMKATAKRRGVLVCKWKPLGPDRIFS